MEIVSLIHFTKLDTDSTFYFHYSMLNPIWNNLISICKGVRL